VRRVPCARVRARVCVRRVRVCARTTIDGG